MHDVQVVWNVISNLTNPSDRGGSGKGKDEEW